MSRIFILALLLAFATPVFAGSHGGAEKAAEAATEAATEKATEKATEEKAAGDKKKKKEGEEDCE
jgi:hypothetical protein